MNQEEKKKKSIKTMGIVALVLGVLAFMTSFFVIPGIIFAIISLILSIIVLVKKGSKAYGLTGLILSILGIIISVSVTVFFVYIINLGIEETSSDNIFEYIEKAVESTDKISSNQWEFDDGSLAVLESNKKFTWYKDPNVKTDNYYKGTYKVLKGEWAIEEIEKTEAFAGSFFTEFFNMYENVLKDDIYYLEFTENSIVIDGKETLNAGEVKYSKHFLVFTQYDNENAYGFNMDTLNTLSIKKVTN